MKKITKSAFTLIELLVVITIIGILATIWVNQFWKSLQKARDGKRTSDILTIKTAVTQAFTDDQEYPKPDSSFSGAVSPYVDLLPKDQKAGQPWQHTGSEDVWLDYIYTSGNDEWWIEYAAYEISTAFESAANLKNVAANTKDNWNDDSRKEIGSVSRNFNTKTKKWKNCANPTASAGSSDDPAAIIIRWKDICKTIN